jgi:hypothetical protein
MGYGISILDTVYRCGQHNIDTVIPDIDMGYGLTILEMTVSIWSSSSIWSILSLCRFHMVHRAALIFVGTQRDALPQHIEAAGFRHAPISIRRMTLSMLSSPISLANIPYR